MRIGLALILFCCVSLAYGADVFDRTQPRQFNLADQLESDATIGGYPIWQGEKKWRIANISTRNSSGDAQPIPLGELVLFQTEGKKFVAMMVVTANLAQGGSKGWYDEPCKRDDMLYKASSGPDFWNENCITINHVTGFPGNPTGRSAELYSLLRENGVDVPPTIIRVTLSRTGPSLRMYRVILNINPELAGISREPETQWGRNRWHKSTSANDPEKRQFIDALVRWATPFAKQMEAAYQKRGDAFISIPSWRSIFDGQSFNSSAKPKALLD